MPTDNLKYSSLWGKGQCPLRHFVTPPPNPSDLGEEGRAEWPMSNERDLGRQLVGHRVDACHVQRLVNTHLWQNARQRTRQQGLTGSGRTDKQYVLDKKPGTSQSPFQSIRWPFNTHTAR